MDKKKLLNIILSTGSALLLIFGQLQILVFDGVLAGTAATLTALAVLFLVIMDKTGVVTEFIKKTAGALKSADRKINSSITDSIPAGKSKNIVTEKQIVSLPAVSGIPEKLNFREIKFSIHTYVIFAILGFVFICAQYFLLTGSVRNGLILLAFAIAGAVAVFRLKVKKIDFSIGFANILKFLFFVAGAALVAVGWVFLINPKVTVQEMGVALTIPGTLLLLFCLPDYHKNSGNDDEKIDYVFERPLFLKNFFVKIGLVAAAVIIWVAGSKVIADVNYNIYGVMLYGLALMLVFFASPVIDFSTIKPESKIAAAVRFVLVAIALYIAYKGQQMFVAGSVNPAVKNFILAGIMFIVAFPIKDNKFSFEKKEGIPVKFEIIFLILITAVAAYLRFKELDIRPFGIENDEAGGLTARISHTGDKTLNLTVGNFGIYIHIVRIFIEIFGGIDRWGIRMMPAVVGVLAVPMMYYFIRNVFNVKTAVFITVVFAFLRWNVYFSRYTSPVIMSLMAEIGMFYFFFKAIQTRNKLYFFLSGLCMTLTWHGPMTFFLLVLPFSAYFIYELLVRRRLFKQTIVGIMAFVCGSWIFGSMIVHNYFISKRIYFARASEVSVFSKDPNAPSKNVGMGIVNNTKSVMLMFNHRGDSRTRNSGGMPYEPAVDFTTALLFAIGFIYALYYSKYHQFFILLLAFFSQAAGSIFSIEAPSSMRAVGTMIPMIYFAAITFNIILKSSEDLFGKKGIYVIYPLLLVLFLLPIVKDNYAQYFKRWITGMDELATGNGMYAKMLGDKTDVVLYTSLYYPEHPPYKMFRREKKYKYSYDKLTSALAELRNINDEDFAIFFHYDTWDGLDDVKTGMFPGAKVTSINHKLFNPKLKDEGIGEFGRALEISNEEIKKARGLTAKYSYTNEPKYNSIIAFEPGSEKFAPYKAEWKGMMLAPYYGKYVFKNRGSVSFELEIDGKKIGQGDEVTLAEGFHKIAVRSTMTKQGDVINLYINTSKLVNNSIVLRDVINLDERILYNFQSHGLTGSYYQGFGWDQRMLMYEMISMNAHLGGGGWYNDSYIWKGSVIVRSAGRYQFSLQGNGYSRIVIDNKYYTERMSHRTEENEAAAKYFAGSAHERKDYLDLAPGKYRITLYYSANSKAKLMWNRNGVSEIIPYDCLVPDAGK